LERLVRSPATAGAAEIEKTPSAPGGMNNPFQGGSRGGYGGSSSSGMRGGR